MFARGIAIARAMNKQAPSDTDIRHLVTTTKPSHSNPLLHTSIPELAILSAFFFAILKLSVFPLVP